MAGNGRAFSGGATAVGFALGIRIVLCMAGCGSSNAPGPPPGSIPGGGGSSDIDPVGIFFNRFTSEPLSGTEILQILPTSQTDTFLVSTLFGEGLICEIDADGDISVQSVITGSGSASGTGEFSGADDFALDPTITIPGQFTDAVFAYVANRITDTDEDFPLEAAASTVNATVLGSYEAVVTEINPETGSALGAGVTETITLSREGDALRLTRPSGAYYQGVFVNSSRVAFRVVNGATGQFATFTGSANNVSLDMAGVMDFDTDGTFDATLVFQSRAARGNQEQFQLRIEGVPDEGGDPGTGQVVTVEITNMTLSDVRIELIVSSQSNASVSEILASGTEIAIADPVLLGVPGANTSVGVPCDTTGSLLLRVTESPTGLFPAISDVLRTPQDFDCIDLLQYTITGAVGFDFQITDIVVPQ